MGQTWGRIGNWRWHSWEEKHFLAETVCAARAAGAGGWWGGVSKDSDRTRVKSGEVPRLEGTPEQVAWPRSGLEAPWILARTLHDTRQPNDLGAACEAVASQGRQSSQWGTRRLSFAVTLFVVSQVTPLPPALGKLWVPQSSVVVWPPKNPWGLLLPRGWPVCTLRPHCQRPPATWDFPSSPLEPDVLKLFSSSVSTPHLSDGFLFELRPVFVAHNWSPKRCRPFQPPIL